MRIIRERNILPKTDYAPTFNIPIGVAKFDEEKTLGISIKITNGLVIPPDK